MRSAPYSVCWRTSHEIIARDAIIDIVGEVAGEPRLAVFDRVGADGDAAVPGVVLGLDAHIAAELEAGVGARDVQKPSPYRLQIFTYCTGFGFHRHVGGLRPGGHDECRGSAEEKALSPRMRAPALVRRARLKTETEFCRFRQRTRGDSDILHDCCKNASQRAWAKMENFRHVKRRPLRVASTALPAVRRRGCARHGLRQNRTGVHRCARLRGVTISMMRQAVLVLAAARARAGAAAILLDGAALRWPCGAPLLRNFADHCDRSAAVSAIVVPPLWQARLRLDRAGTLAPLAAFHGISNTAAAFVHAVLAEYLSFIVLLFALYVVAGGILVTGNLRGTPLVNTAMLAFGTSIASVVGTTGAAMILIRPLLRANAARLDNVHVVVFFIFLVANIGGALSPLGDPPLFVGFLHGVDFFWTTRNLWFETVLVAALVLAAFLALDVWHYRRDRLVSTVGEAKAPMRLGVSGSINLLLIAAIIAAILASATWTPGISFDVYGTAVELQNIARDIALLMIAMLSLALTPNEHREATPGNRSPKWRSVRRHLHLHHSRARRAPGRQGRLCTGSGRRQCRRRPAARRRLFLAHRRAVRLSRQRADLSRVLRARRR